MQVDMNRRIVTVALAVFLALVGTIAVFGYVHGADKRALAKTTAVRVVIADKRVPAGTTWQDAIKGGYLHADRVPADAAPSDAISSLGTSIPMDQVSSADIPAGQIVLRQMFGQKTAVTGAVAIPKGKIAVAVSMSGNADVAGYVQPSSEVAIFATFKLKADQTNAATGGGTLGGTDLYATKLVLPRIQVLATSQNAPGDVNGGKSNGNGNGNSNVFVTLALSQAEAERVILAQQVGELYLGLLSDTSVTSPDGGTLGVARFKPTPIFVQ
jgi:pilus assembly protein CpaB